MSCGPAASCTAVGYYFTPKIQLAPAEHRNGSTWAPRPPHGGAVALNGDSCRTAAGCTAVGQDVKNGAGHALAEHWNGRAWAGQETAQPGRGRLLASVWRLPAGPCTAVGARPKGSKGAPVAEGTGGGR